MSVRIHILSKQIGMENAELLNLLRGRGFDVKSASSTIDNISAAALLEEYKDQVAAQAAKEGGGEAPSAAAAPPQREPEPEPAAAAEPAPKLPSGPIVRSRDEIEKEKREKEEAERKAHSATVVAPPPPPAVPGRPAGSAPVRALPSQPKTPPPFQPGPPRPAPAPTRMGPPAPSSSPAAAGRAPLLGGTILRPATPPAPPAVTRVVSPPPPSISTAAAQAAPAGPVPSPAATPTGVSAPAAGPVSAPAGSGPGPTPASGSGVTPPPFAGGQAGGGQRTAGGPAVLQPAGRAPLPGGAKTGAPFPAGPGGRVGEERPRMDAPRTPQVPPPAVPAEPVRPPQPRAMALPPGSGRGAGTMPPAIPGGEAAVPVISGGPAGEEKPITVKPPIVVRDFAVQLGMKPFRLISELMEMGIFASMNQAIEEEVAARVAKAHGFKLEIYHRGEAPPPQKKKEKPKVEETEHLEPRPPVVCILGHVDHGKTTLLDTIRKTHVVEGEAGGITQHIGAYQVENAGNKITFLDTPGHAAFSKMRERGANLTDIAVLVVAADDGFMPQTDEALKFANRAQVAKIVAINKIDMPGANVDRVKRQMQERGIPPEDLGGDIITVPVSALKGVNISQLLEMIQLQAEIMELKANPKGPAEGVIIESQVEQGRGSVATVIVQKGTLKVGDALISGITYCKVRSIVDDRGNAMKTAGPSAAVKVVGWADPPEVGAPFEWRKNDREAKREAADREHELKLQAANSASSVDAPAATVEDLFAAIEKQDKKTLRVLLKADVAGSLEAISACLMDIKSTKVNLELVQEDVGIISKTDVDMAHAAGGATIVGFNTKLENGVQGLAKHHGIQIYIHNIIYELIDMVRDAMADLLEPELREKKLGRADIRAIFGLGKGQQVAGCMVTEGVVRRDGMARVFRGKEIINDGKVGTLRRFKEDVGEVRAGYECGIRLENFDHYQVGDVIECYEIEKVRPNL